MIRDLLILLVAGALVLVVGYFVREWRIENGLTTREIPTMVD